MLEGRRVVLRPIEKEDIGLFLKWFNDPKVTQYLIFYLPLTREFEEEWIARVSTSSTDVVFMIEVKGENGNPNVPIGNCGLHSINWKDRHATFGIAIGEKEYWKNGYGTEATGLLLEYGFGILNLNRISSSVFAFNNRSISMHKRLGFQVEGLRRKVFFKRGRYCDEILFGILQSEWKKKKK